MTPRLQGGWDAREGLCGHTSCRNAARISEPSIFDHQQNKDAQMKPVTELLPTSRAGPPTRKPKEDPGQGKKVKNLGLFFYIYSAYSTA